MGVLNSYILIDLLEHLNLMKKLFKITKECDILLPCII